MGINRRDSLWKWLLLSLSVSLGILFWTLQARATADSGGTSSTFPFFMHSYTEIGKKIHVQKNLFDHTYRVTLTNNGTADAFAVDALLTSLDPQVEVLDGNLSFGDIPAGASVVSRDTFTIRLPANVKFDPAMLQWRFGQELRPTANAGPDQNATVGATVRLDGSASSDGDGDPLHFHWSLITVPEGSTAILSDPASVNPTLTLDKSGVYVAQLVVDDGTLSSPPDTVTLSTVNSTPVAAAGPDQSGPVGGTIFLDGRGSSDADGDPLTYSWVLTLMPAGSTARLSDPTSPTPSFTLDQPGYYSAQLVVNDGTVDSEPDLVSITTLNSRPIAEAGPDQSAQVGAAVTLDGSSSSDRDGDPLTYHWALLSRPDGSSATLSDATAIRPNFILDHPGTYIVQLVVRDATTESDPDTVTITTLNSRPVAQAGPDQGVPVGTPVQLDGSGSSDADGDLLNYRWSLTAIPAGSAASLSDPVSVHPGFTVDQPGNYIAQLVVNDGQLDSLPDTVTVSTVNGRPVADAGPDQQARVGDTVRLDGAGSRDPDGDPLTYRWSLLNVPEGSLARLDDPAAPVVSFPADRAGDYVAQLIVNDGRLDSDPDTALIQVTAPLNLPPIIASAPLTGATVGQAYAYLVEATDPEGQVLGYALEDAPAGMTIDPASGLIQWIPLADGTFSVTVAVDDGHGGLARQTFSLVVAPASGGNGGLPSDPAQVAPPVDPTVATTVADSTKFLYTGRHPIQTGVAEGTIEPRRAAVIRGQALDKANAPLPGVAVTIKGHPEFGQTLTRADGWFDLAVNGGGLLALNYDKAGYLPSQRQLDVPWQDFAIAEDVVLIALDPQVTAIDLADTARPFQVAQGSVSTDVDGSRQATLLFPQGTHATLTLPDGSQQPLATLHVRATEYTVGENGPQAMPGPLPPTSGYTYAVELSADEALAAGAKRVEFDQPVPVYVDNFLNFPVGETVPVGWYDRDKAAWIPSDNGKVIQILSIAAGAAQIDTDGDGLADDSAKLVALGITPDEQAQLAALYAAGKTLWRAPVRHFTPWDCNWPYGPPDDAEPPPAPDDKDKKDPPPDDESDECEGCSINPQARTMGETIPVTGTPYALHYQSRRARGYKAGRMIDIPLAGANLPASLQSIDLSVTVAGKTFTRSFPVAPNQSYGFEWDGVDGYGRPVEGSSQATVTVRYHYPAVYYVASADFERSFALASLGADTSVIGQRNASTIALQRTWHEQLDAARTPAALSLGVWSLDIHHAYDPVHKTLELGTGQKRKAYDVGKSITTIAGGTGGGHGYGGYSCYSWYSLSGYPGEYTHINWISSINFDPLGNLYYADGGCVYRLSPDGIVNILAGGSWSWPSLDEIPATQANLQYASGSALGPDGSLYIVDFQDYRVRRVDSAGIIHAFAGTAEYGDSGDGASALAAQMMPWSVAAGSDGSVYISDAYSGRIRRVGPDGIITTVAGNGIPGYSGDGGPATQAQIGLYSKISLGPDGSIYISDTHNARIRRVGSDGIITTVAGNGIFGYSGDGGPATQAKLSSNGISVDLDGTLYIVDSSSRRIRRVGQDGIITTVAGSGDGVFGSSFVMQARLLAPSAVGLGPDDNLYVGSGDGYTGAIYRISSALPELGFGDTNTFIPSSDGTEIYNFDSQGRHLRTLNALTRAVLYSFGYDSAGHLSTITDADGDITHIERDTSGNVTAIIAPNGQITPLAYDAQDYLATVTNPAGEAHRMSYTSDGLLSTFTDPEGQINTFTYDKLGRLNRDIDAIGGGWTVTATAQATGYTTAMTTAEGRTTQFTVEHLPTGDRRQINTYPDGTALTRLFKISGEETSTTPDGTIATVLKGPDPRFSMLVPVVTSATVKTPSGRTAILSETRSVTLADNHPLSLTSFTETATLNGKTSKTVYDAASRTFTATSPENRTTTTVINDRGRPVTSQTPGLEPVQFIYDTRGRRQDITQGQGTDARTVHYEYYADGPSQGYLHTVTDPLRRTVSYEYDAAGRVILKTLPDGRSTQFGYDRNGNLISLIPPGQPAHLFDYTAVNQTDSYTPPTVEAADPVTRYTYNKDKQLELVTRPGGEIVDFVYDSSTGRLQTVTAPHGDTSYAYDSAGRLQTLTAPGGMTLDYAYDGSLLTQTTWTGPITGNVGYAYNNDFRVREIKLNGAAPIAYGYDKDSLLTSAGALTLSRDPRNGLLTGTSLASGANTTTDSLTYNGFGEVTEYSAKFNLTELFNVQSIPDALGRLTRKAEAVHGVVNMFDYAYDPAGRLEEVKQNNVTTALYGYDDNGNRTTVNGQTVAHYDAQDRLLDYQGTTYAYTANGELQSKTQGGATTGYRYDVFGNLRHVDLPGGTQLDYLIDGQNRRIGKQINGTPIQGFLYQDGLRIIAELDGGNQVVSRFVYAHKGNVPVYLIKGGVTYRIISDHLGSPRLVVDTANGTVIQRLDYDEWGRVIQDTHPGFQPFGYAGGLYDRDTGLVRFGARDYDAETGRWTAKDPIGFGGGDANVYGYVGNDPVNSIDQLGLCDCSGILKDAIRLNNDPDYGYDGKHGPGPGKNKCNAFVDDVLKNTGIAPRRWGGFGGPISAGTWANPETDIPHFPVVNDPQPGDIMAIAFPYTDASGHVAVVLDPGILSIGAGGHGSHVTGWPWDKNLAPQGTPVFRRCTC
jgi:RHS repeat-associated protein